MSEVRYMRLTRSICLKTTPGGPTPRPKVVSYVKLQLPHAMSYEKACEYMSETMPRWEICNGPDEGTVEAIVKEIISVHPEGVSLKDIVKEVKAKIDIDQVVVIVTIVVWHLKHDAQIKEIKNSLNRSLYAPTT